MNEDKYEDMIINLFTHIDLDGSGCAVLGKLYALEEQCGITVCRCDYNNINQQLCHLMDQIEYAESINVLPNIDRKIMITDISPSYETAVRLDRLQNSHPNISVVLIDHHQVKEEIKSFWWATVYEMPDCCGTSLMYESLKPFMDETFKRTAATSFVGDVCLYDTWRFDKSVETNSENLNILMGLLGAEEFEDMVVDWIWKHPFESFIVDMLECYPFIEQDRNNRKKYCALRNASMRKISYKEYTVGVAFAERYISSVGDYLLTKNTDLDFVAIVNLPSSVSLRTKSESVNVGLDIARPLGGGGHPQAAGYQLENIPDDLIKKLIKLEGE